MVILVRKLLILFLLPLAMWPGGAAAAAKPVTTTIIALDRVVAVVNDDVITQTELEQFFRKIKSNLIKQKIKLPDDKRLKKQVLERLVLERLQLQHASRRGIRIKDSQLNKAIDNIAASNKMTREQLLKTVLKVEGMDEKQYKEELRKKIILRRLIDREIRSRINISEIEIKEFLQNRNLLIKQNQAFSLSHILIQIPEASSSDVIKQAEERAKQVYTQLKTGGGDFAQLAISYSQDKYALQGGLIGWRKPQQIPEMFLKALQGMKKGDVSDIIRSPNGFHILRLNDIRGLKNNTSEAVIQTKVRHILIKPDKVLPADEARKKALQLRERIIQGEDFATLARVHSDDTLSARKGGDLGWANPNTFLPQFEKVMNRLKPSEISQAVKTRFGFHIIQVEARRRQDIGDEKLRANARKALMTRKTDTNYQLWLRQLRGESYVKYIILD